MPEKRTSKVYTHIEPSIQAIVDDICKKENISTSTYLRRLAVHDLMNRGLLLQEHLARIVA